MRVTSKVLLKVHAHPLRWCDFCMLWARLSSSSICSQFYNNLCLLWEILIRNGESKWLRSQKASPNYLTMSLRKAMKWKQIGETMSIIHLENNHRKINKLEEIKILKAVFFKYLLNYVITRQNNSMYRLIPSVSD